MEFATFTLGDLDTNCYLLWDNLSGDALIVDPGDGGDFLSEELLHRDLTLTNILLTHGHSDHVLGLLELKLNFGVPIWLHAADETLLKRAASSANHWLKREVDPVPPADHWLIDGQEITLGKENLRVLHIPGHTPGSVAFIGSEVVLTGDTIFKDSVGGTDHAYSNRKLLWESIAKLRNVAAGKLALPGHGESFWLE